MVDLYIILYDQKYFTGSTSITMNIRFIDKCFILYINIVILDS